MAHWNPVDQMQDLVNKFGDDDRIKRFQSGELVLVERNVASAAVSPQSLDDGGVTFKTGLDVEAFFDDHAKFLREVFKIGLPKRNKIVVPKTRQGFGWGVFLPKGMTIERVVASYSDICPVWRWTNENLDSIVKSVRSANNNVIWFRDRVEADEEHKKKSANDIKLAGINSITLLERLLLGRWFHYRTNQHLDVVNVTRCDGSRFSVGSVPFVYFYRDNGRVCVDRYNPYCAFDDLRSRQAVS